MFEIIDDRGVIHSGTEEEMLYALDVMIEDGNFPDEDVEKYSTDWIGDLKLVKVIKIVR